MSTLIDRMSEARARYELIASLPLELESYTLAPLRQPVVPGYARRTTIVCVRGGAHEGIGEDVTPPEAEQLAFLGAGATLHLAGRWTFDSFSRRLDTLLPPALPNGVPTTFRRWAFESAALDLALRQAGRSLAGILGVEARPVRFVNSIRLSPTSRPDAVEQRLEIDPMLRFKLDPAPDWDDELIARLATTRAVMILDFKGQYPPQAPIGLPPDPQLYARVASAFPDAWLEDPSLRADALAALKPHLGRVTWDAPVTSASDLERVPVAPAAVNVKPARIGTLRRLFELYAYCAHAGLPIYGGGTFELGPGRRQLQYLAALFHPDGPNDVAPVVYNRPRLPHAIPRSPLVPAIAPTGFR